MAVDKLVDSTQLDADLTSVANAIRTKGGTSASLAFPSGFVSAIANIPSGGGAAMRTGTFTPTTFKTSVSFSVGTTDTIKNLLVVPTSESPLKSTGKTLYAFIANADLFLKSMIVASNNTGTTLLAPSTSTSSTRFTQSADTVTINSNAGSFELISYTWFAW